MIEGSDALKASRKLEGLQVGRGIAAIAVVLTHAVGHPFAHAPGIVALPGAYGVSLFFVISGFIMVRTTGAGQFNPIEFMKHRLLRVVPIYYVATALLALLAAIAPGQFKTTVLNVPHIVRSLLFIPSYAPRDPGAIFPFYKLGWTLNFEMFFYVVFALCAFMAARTRIWTIAAIFAVLIAVGQSMTFDNAILDYYTRSNIIGFVAGMFLAMLGFADRPALSTRVASALLALSLFGLAGVATVFGLIRETIWEQLSLTAIALLHGMLLLGYADRDGRKVSPGLLHLGNASYAIYLFHMFAVGPIHAAFKRLWPDHLAIAMAAAFVGGTALGIIAHRFLEKPLVARFRPKRPVAPTSDNPVPALRDASANN